MARRWLLSVGVNDYATQIELPNLRCAVNDACHLYNLLTTEYNFEGILLAAPRDVAASVHPTLAEVSAGNGTREGIIHQINTLRRRMEPDDIFVLFYAGHGLGQHPGHLVPFGGLQGKTSSLLDYRTLFAELCALPCGEQLLFFNCCYAGLARAGAGAVAGFRSAPVFALSASGPGQVAPDRIPGHADGEYSPFASVLADHLEGLDPGKLFDPHALMVRLNAVYERLSGIAGDLTPMLHQEIDGRPTLHRPGLRLRTKSTHTCRAGESLEVPLEAERKSGNGKPLICEVAPARGTTASSLSTKSSDESHALLRVEGSTLTIRLGFAGTYDFNVWVKDPDTKEVASRGIKITVEPAEEAPLRIATEPLAVCRKGDAYEARITASGGMPPYEWSIDGLPEPLRWKAGERGARIEISGLVPEAPGEGSAESQAAVPVAHELRVTVQDEAEDRCEVVRRLIIVGRDYVEIPNGEFKVGYTQSLEGRQAIRDLLQDEGRKRGKTGRALETFVSHSLTHVEAELEKTNPGSNASLPQRFFIKKYPVTNRDWLAFVRANPLTPHVPVSWRNQTCPDGEEKYPVTGVDYAAIRAYLEWKGTRLPSAWEWERAARGTDGRLFPWGDRFVASACNAKSDVLTPVDAHEDEYPEEIGVRDIVGNAAEWVDRRVFQDRKAIIGNLELDFYFAQVFRGGSAYNFLQYSLTCRDSAEAALLFGPHDEFRDLASGRIRNALKWVGFRDVVAHSDEPDPPQGLIEIPACEVDINGRKVDVAAFRMARYAVSNDEYLAFVVGTDHPSPYDWDPSADPPFTGTKRHLPVVHVTYRDALAFCLWKSRETGEIVRIPSLEQWAAALSGGEGRAYPWGQDFDLHKCNSRESGWGRRLPVHHLREGGSKHGVYQLVGNVFEWVAPNEVCGGSWLWDCDRLRTQGFVCPTKTTGSRPFRDDNDTGFRYVVLEPLEK